MTPEQMLREFHASKQVRFHPLPDQPTADIPGPIAKLRHRLLAEEVGELADAIRAGDIVKIADALGDIVYVAVGTAITYGIPFDAVLREIHRSNMTKDNAPEDAKLVKGPGYQPPDISSVFGHAAIGDLIGTFGGDSPCDAPNGGSYMFADGKIRCRCVVCARCGHHTGNSHQGHYWRYCKVTSTMREFHTCCPDPAFGCELATPDA